MKQLEATRLQTELTELIQLAEVPIYVFIIIQMPSNQQSFFFQT
jgi:hypothetical protein